MLDLDGRPAVERDMPTACATTSGGVVAGPPMRIRTADGGERIVQPVAAPLFAEGEPVGAVGLWRDVTERERLIADLQAKSAALTEADRRKNEFLALLGHELRNPLAAVSTSAQLLDRLGVAARGRRSLDIILRQVGQLTRMVDDLLDVARITHGRIQLRAEDLDLREPALRAVEATRPAIASRRHQLLLDLPAEPLWVRGDPARLEQVVANLLHNAAKYTDTGGAIELRGGREAGRVWLSVQDNGVGIRPELMAHIFEPFSQADRSLAHSAGGLGLGLALVRQLMLLHGGGAEVQSEGHGRGSLFRIHLPALDPGGFQDRAAVVVARAEQRRRILVVEDQSDVAEPLAEQLRLLGHQVQVARTSEEALQAARDDVPEVLLLDIGLPDMDGYELARRIHEQAGRPVPTIAVTGYGQDEARRRSIAAGFAHHLVKPVDLSVLQQILEHDLLDGSETGSE
jgi:signal transduction histidine kinase/ActR/RegA family two-component response regulator